eukprot:549515_1
MGLFLIKIIDKNEFDLYFQNIVNEKDTQLHSDISILANKLQNGVDSILTSSSLMQNDARPMQFNPQIPKTHQYKIEKDYKFLALCHRSLINFRHKYVTKICIEGYDENIDDRLIFICRNCNISIHADCAFGTNIQFYHQNESKLWICGCCSSLLQFNGVVFVESIEEVKRFGETTIQNTIIAVTERINMKINGKLCGISNSVYSEYLQIVFNINEIRVFLLSNYLQADASSLLYWTGIVIRDMTNNTVIDSNIYYQSFIKMQNKYAILRTNMCQTLTTKHLLNILMSDINENNQQQTNISFVDIGDFKNKFSSNNKSENDEEELFEVLNDNEPSSDIIFFYFDNSQGMKISVQTNTNTHSLAIVTNNADNGTSSIIYDLTQKKCFTIKDQLLFVCSDISNYRNCWNFAVFVNKTYKLTFEKKNQKL